MDSKKIYPNKIKFAIKKSEFDEVIKETEQSVDSYIEFWLFVFSGVLIIIMYSR